MEHVYLADKVVFACEEFHLKESVCCINGRELVNHRTDGLVLVQDHL